MLLLPPLLLLLRLHTVACFVVEMPKLFTLYPTDSFGSISVASVPECSRAVHSIKAVTFQTCSGMVAHSEQTDILSHNVLHRWHIAIIVVVLVNVQRSDKFEKKNRKRKTLKQDILIYINNHISSRRVHKFISFLVFKILIGNKNCVLVFSSKLFLLDARCKQVIEPTNLNLGGKFAAVDK